MVGDFIEDVQGWIGRRGQDSDPKDSFVRRMKPYAERWQAQTGIPASVYIAMLASETNYGKADSWFGMKGSGDAGSTNYATWEMVDGKRVEVNDNFAKFSTPDKAHEAFVALMQKPLYKKSWDALQQTGDWQSFLQGINKAGYATDTEWASKIAGMTPDITKRGGLSNINPNAGQNSTTQSPVQPKTNGYTDLSKMPNPQDFYTTDADGTTYFDDMAFGSAIEAHAAWQTSRKMQREYELGPASQVIDDIIGQIGLKISAGQLDLAKANSLFKTQVDSYQMALDAFEGEAFKYGTPAGAQYQSGFEPDSYNVTQLGLAPKSNIGPTVDPLAKAMELAGMGQSMIGGIQTPSVPDVPAMRREMFQNNGAMPGAAPPTVNSPAPTSGQPTEGILTRFGDAASSATDILKAALQRAHERTLIGGG